MKSCRGCIKTLHSLKTATFKKEIRKFEKVYPQIVHELIESADEADVPQVHEWFGRVLNYNVPSSNKSKGMTVPLCYKSLEDPEKLTPEKEKLSHVLGWCVELNQAAFMMQDDIIDGGITRRRRPCWHQLVDVIAVNDSTFLENSPFKIIKHYFSRDQFYAKYMELFHVISWKVLIVQALEAVTVKDAKDNINAHSMSRFETIVKYKSESYSFLFPATLAIYLANKYDPKIYEQVRPILEKFGRLLQVHNDVMDVYGDPAYTGYVGTDIQGGKCTWLICAAIERANSDQKNILQANYGKDHPDAVRAVIETYDDLDMKGVYDEYETKLLQSVRKQIQQISEGFPNKSFLTFLNDYAIQRNWQEKEWWCT